MALSDERLHEIAIELASRPKHEKVRALVFDLLTDGLGAKSTEIDLEKPLPEVRGRIDALLGRTVFEFKSDLRREQQDAENQLPDYLAQRERETGAHFVAVATDGATFLTYELRQGSLQRLDTFTNVPDKPRELLGWLSAVVSVNEDLEPSAEVVSRELGRSSLAWSVARRELETIWREVSDQPDVRLKRDLWAQLLRQVYGTALSEDALFLQHTYLTIIAKTMAAKVLGVQMSQPQDLLSGRGFKEAGIGGVVESDFFDWPLASFAGAGLVHSIALQASRFKLENIQTDVLKGLYESLIDPEQRHFLGEYYTPDWLAEKICAEAITDPLKQRVLDPACGSGTFVFHAVRRLQQAAKEAKMPAKEAINLACHQVFGVDVHPVSAQIARVTFLLAIGQENLKQRPDSFNVPVYIGDSLQWNTQGFLAERHVLIRVPEDDKNPGDVRVLEFPFEIAQDPNLFDAVIERMLSLSQSQAEAGGLTAWLERTYQLSEATLNTIAKTYSDLHYLQGERRDHIWGFVARNLVRPVWLAQESQKVDVLVGNPPWLSYRFMDANMQTRFREECIARGLWMGQVAQQQDLSAYFYVRCVELYQKSDGKIAFVMPYAAMTRRQFAGFRTGIYGSRTGRSPRVFASIKFTEAWSLDGVAPLFPVPSCVLFAENATHEGKSGRLPSTILAATGELPERNLTLKEASHYIRWEGGPWPEERESRITKGYAARFRDGAVVFPSVLFRVQLTQTSMLGSNPAAPLVESRRSNQEKVPWKEVHTLRGNVEKQFLRELYLGESIAPFRTLTPILAVVPWDESTCINASEAQTRGYAHLANWLTQAEQLWEAHGSGRRTLKEQCDYFGQLSAQFPIAPLRVAYAASGTLPAACLVEDQTGIIEHKLYWASIVSKQEGYYLIAILNSETARKRTEAMQSRGQWGARDFDKVMLSLPIPQFNPKKPLHLQLVKAAVHAEEVAAAVPLGEGMHFIKARQEIRKALQADGIAQTMDKMVARLLDSNG